MGYRDVGVIAGQWVRLFVLGKERCPKLGVTGGAVMAVTMTLAASHLFALSAEAFRDCAAHSKGANGKA
jgi:hypothetical protein